MAKEGLKQLLKMLKKVAKKLAQAVAKGVAKVIEFLVSNPVGWVILAILIVLLIIFLVKWASDKKKQVDEDAFLRNTFSATVMVADADCKGTKSKTEAQEAATEIDKKTQEAAHKIYAVFHEYGLTDEMIAGMLGNIEHESLYVDSTTVEGIYDEPFQVGERTKEAVDGLPNYTDKTLFPLYDRSGCQYRVDGYTAEDGKHYCGVGLIQWTGPSAKLLIDSAGGNDWSSFEYQLAYMLCDSIYRPGFFKDWKENKTFDTPEAAAENFRIYYEGNSSLGMAESKENAVKWYGVITSEWNTEDSSLTDFIKNLWEMATNMATVAIDTATSITRSKCANKLSGKYDNSSLASAAVSYAYPTHAESENNKGTALYIKVHDNVFPGDNTYMSCDRSVGAAVRWSGMDEDFPAGNSDNQYAYMKGSDRWESIGFSNTIKIEDLQPGDIWSLNGHILMYVGHDIISEMHGKKADDDADSVSGSLGKRSPGCGNDASKMINLNGGMDWNDRGAYEIFRCVNPTPSDKYKDAGG